MKKTDDIPCMCRYCEFSARLNDEDLVICKKRGVVLADHRCRKFFPDLTKMDVEITAIPLTPQAFN